MAPPAAFQTAATADRRLCAYDTAAATTEPEPAPVVVVDARPISSRRRAGQQPLTPSESGSVVSACGKSGGGESGAGEGGAGCCDCRLRVHRRCRQTSCAAVLVGTTSLRCGNLVEKELISDLIKHHLFPFHAALPRFSLQNWSSCRKHG